LKRRNWRQNAGQEVRKKRRSLVMTTNMHPLQKKCY